VDSFAFIIHPIDPKHDIARKYPLLARVVNDWAIYQFAPYFPPVYLSEVEGITSACTGKQIKGWLIACPLTPKHFMQLPEKQVYRKIIETGRLAEKLGAKILGLGAYTSVVGDAGLTVAQALDVPVTTGDAYTVAVAVQTIKQAARVMDIPLEGAVAAVVGATGAIGKASALLLCRDVAELYLISRHQEDLARVRDELIAAGSRARLHVRTSMYDLQEASIILTVTSAIHAVIESEHIQPGSVVCDVAQPRDASARIATSRQDVLVIDGGMVEVPGKVDFHFDFGLPAGKAYACMAETMALTLEGRLEDYTLGRNLTLEKVEEISSIAEKHGFQLSGFRSFERPVTDEQIDCIKQNAARRRGHS
jgi:fatty aldehyde-generating acyl-ACP reductase